MEEDHTAVPGPNATHLEDEVTTEQSGCKVKRLMVTLEQPGCTPGRSIFMVLPSQAPNNCRRVINFVFVSAKDSEEDNIIAAVHRNNQCNFPFTLYGRYFRLRKLVSPLIARDMKEALCSADMFMCSFIFGSFFEQVLAYIVAPVRDRLAVCFCLFSSPGVMALTKLGLLGLAVKPGGPTDSFIEVLREVWQRHGIGHETVDLKHDLNKAAMCQVAALPKVVGVLPKVQAKDATDYVLATQHRVECFLEASMRDFEAAVNLVAGQVARMTAMREAGEELAAFPSHESALSTRLHLEFRQIHSAVACTAMGVDCIWERRAILAWRETDQLCNEHKFDAPLTNEEWYEQQKLK